jgi:hypothetical protein
MMASIAQPGRGDSERRGDSRRVRPGDGQGAAVRVGPGVRVGVGVGHPMPQYCPYPLHPVST